MQTPNSSKIFQNPGNLSRCPPGFGNKRPHCCSYGLFQRMIVHQAEELQTQEVREVHIPLKKVGINAILEGAIATTNVQLTYKNEYMNPIECTYEFPLEKTTLLSKLVIKLGD